MDYNISSDVEIISLDPRLPMDANVRTETLPPNSVMNEAKVSQLAKAQDLQVLYGQGGFFIPSNQTNLTASFLTKEYKTEEYMDANNKKGKFYYASSFNPYDNDLFAHSVQGYFAQRPGDLIELRIWAKTGSLLESYVAARKDNSDAGIYIIPGTVRPVFGKAGAIYWQADGCIAVPADKSDQAFKSLNKEDQKKIADLLRTQLRESITAELTAQHEVDVEKAVATKLASIRSLLSDGLDLIAKVEQTDPQENTLAPEIQAELDEAFGPDED